MRLPPVEKNVTIGQNLKAANAYSTLPEVDLISLDLDEVFIGNTNSMIDYAGTTVTTMVTTYPLNKFSLLSWYTSHIFSQINT